MPTRKQKLNKEYGCPYTRQKTTTTSIILSKQSTLDKEALVVTGVWFNGG